MSDTDKIALAALIVAVVGTIGNFWYTRRQFAATNSPVLILNWPLFSYTALNVEPSKDVIQQTKFQIQLKNGHSSVSMSNIKATITLVERHLLSWQTKRTLYSSYQVAFLNPLQDTKQTILKLPSLEDFLKEQGVFQKVSLNHSGGQWLMNEGQPYIQGMMASESTVFYEGPHRKSFIWSCSVTFTPGISGAKQQVLYVTKKFSPIFITLKTGGLALNDWKIQRGVRWLFFTRYVDEVKPSTETIKKNLLRDVEIASSDPNNPTVYRRQ